MDTLFKGVIGVSYRGHFAVGRACDDYKVLRAPQTAAR